MLPPTAASALAAARGLWPGTGPGRRRGPLKRIPKGLGGTQDRTLTAESRQSSRMSTDSPQAGLVEYMRQQGCGGWAQKEDRWRSRARVQGPCSALENPGAPELGWWEQAAGDGVQPYLAGTWPGRRIFLLFFYTAVNRLTFCSDKR